MLSKLVEIQNLKIEDSFDKLVTELAILENKSVKEIKNYSVEMINKLVQKHSYLYEQPKPISEFVIDGVKYQLPITLYGLPYGVWEDIEFINSNDSFGRTFFEKLPYILYILTYGRDYVKNNASDNIMEGSKVFEKMTVKDALGVSTFFLTLKKPLYVNLRVYLNQTVKELLEMIQLQSLIRLIMRIR